MRPLEDPDPLVNAKAPRPRVHDLEWDPYVRSNFYLGLTHVFFPPSDPELAGGIAQQVKGKLF
jgi:hypothetical protein